MFFQYVKNDMDIFLVMLSVYFFGFSKASFCMDSKIIHVYREPSLWHLFLEYGIHHHLEGSRGVCKTKEHDCWLKELFWGKESCFPFISWFYAYVVIPPLYVKLGE